MIRQHEHPIRFAALLLGGSFATAPTDTAAAHPAAISSLQGLPPSGSAFWRRVSEPAREKAARVSLLAQRLMARASASRFQSEVGQRFLASVIAVVELAAVEPRGGGELGFFVGRAWANLHGREPAAAEVWLSAALAECPGSPLAFAAWLQLAQIRTQQGDLSRTLEMLAEAGKIAAAPAEWAKLALERGLTFERGGQWDQARLEYADWLSLEVDETGLSWAGWHLASTLDKLGEHATAMRIIDEAESRAYENESHAIVALDGTGYRHASAVDFHYAQGLKHYWLATRRREPAPTESLQRALAAFETVERSSDRARYGTIVWHVAQIRRVLGQVPVRMPEREQR